MTESVVQIVRILFGLVFFFKILAFVDIRDVAWAHGRPRLFAGRRLFAAHLAAMGALSLAVAAGLWLPVALPVLLVLYVYSFRSVSIFGLEDTVCQSLLVFFVLLESCRLPVNVCLAALACALGIIFFSAGITKLQSPMWRRGLGVYYFFVMPLHRRIELPRLFYRRWLFLPMNHLIVGAQLFSGLVFLLNPVPGGLALWAIQCGFALLLCTVFVFTWLGELLLLALAGVLCVLLTSGTRPLAALAWTELAALEPTLPAWVGFGLLAALPAAFWAASVPHLSARLARTRAHCALAWLSRITWGITPVVLFTEKHMQGPVIFRCFARDAEGGEREVLKVFSPASLAGPERNWRPTIFEVLQYKIAEVCMELDAHGEVRSAPRFVFLLALGRYLKRRAQRRAKTNVTAVRFRVQQLVPPVSYEGRTAWYRELPWIDAFDIDFTGTEPRVVLLDPSRKLLAGPTGRDINRLSFRFNPSAA